MEDYLPQDEYFEWEDILAYRKPEVVDKMIHRVSISQVSSSSRSSSPGDESNTDDDAYHWNDPEIDLSMGHLSASRSVDSSVPLQKTREAETAESSISFPSYGTIPGTTNSSCSPCPKTKLESNAKNIKDDSDVYVAPSIHVDYFSHAWCVEDILASWRHLQSRERSSKNAARLENATWRAWAKVSSDLPIVSPQEIDWLKDIDDTCLYGPFQESAHKEDAIMTCDIQPVTSKTVIKRPCLKKPKISELLLQGSQFSWTGARATITTSDMKRTSSKRAVQFNEIVEQCITVDTSRSSSPGLPQSKSFPSRNTTTPISPTTLKSQHEEPCDIKKANSWYPTTISPPSASDSLAPSDRLAEWTWLGAEEEDELDWISQLPVCSSSTYSTTTQHTVKEIVHDLTAKFEPIPPPTPTRPTFRHSPTPEDRGYIPLSDSESSLSEDEDDLVAQYLFDCKDLERSDSFSSMSASDTSSGSEDGTDEEVEFYVSGRVGREEGDMVVDEKRMMERMQEIPCMDDVKRSFYEQVMEEYNAGWE